MWGGGLSSEGSYLAAQEKAFACSIETANGGCTALPVGCNCFVMRRIVKKKQRKHIGFRFRFRIAKGSTTANKYLLNEILFSHFWSEFCN